MDHLIDQTMTRVAEVAGLESGASLQVLEYSPTKHMDLNKILACDMAMKHMCVVNDLVFVL